VWIAQFSIFLYSVDTNARGINIQHLTIWYISYTIDRSNNVKKKYKVEFFEKSNGTYPAEEYIESLNIKMAAKIYRTLDILEKNGPELREPYSKHLDDEIFEVRAKVSTNIVRVLYFFYIGKRIILTHGFTKKVKKTPPSEIMRAKSYRKEFLESEASKNENS